MKVWIVVERNSGDIEAVYSEEKYAAAHCAQFEDGHDPMYDMQYECHELKQGE